MLDFLLLRARRLAGLLLLACGLATPAHALQGALGLHDPSTIIKSGGKYWVFGTGDGIACKSSTDLISWTDVRSVYTKTAYPGWINGKVPAFAGNFWAPECKFLNGQYYLYYSCSTFGSQVSAIGLATNPTLDPADPAYKWTDQGEVVSTTAASAANAIDPALFTDPGNNLWLTYGSYFGGIRITQLAAATGKPLSLATQYAVASGDVEASYVAYHAGYYYLFINRGTCCQGVRSTYHIQVGRATTPGGPYLDQQSADLNAGGGTLLVGSAARYVGPGHTGLLEENGVTYFSHHYYDGYDNGAPKLGLAQLTWAPSGWPTVSRDWLPAGRYTFKNQNSGLLWQAGDCTGAVAQPLTQGGATGLACQQWDLAPLGAGAYTMTSALGGLAADVSGCLPDAGTKLQLYTPNGLVCQQYGVERASDGTFIFTSATGNNVVEVPNCSTTPGQQLGLWYYNGFGCQRWLPALVGGGPLAAAPAQLLPGVAIYPVPAPAGRFTLELGCAAGVGERTVVEMVNAQGQAVYRQQFEARQTTLDLDTGLRAGLYVVRVRRGGGIFTQKVAVL